MSYGCSVMKFLLPSVLFVIASAIDITSVEWKEYKEKHKKVYTTAYEDTQRLEQYLKTKQMIEEHNERFLKGEVKYTMDINQFADWFPKELSQLTGLKVDESRKIKDEYELEADIDLPKSVNWVLKGAVTEVKNQGKCGSCYAFSAVGALEGLMYIQNKTITDLSPQELVDCSSNYGCDGGLMTECFSYVKEHNGIATDQSYPYEAKKDTCREEGKKIGASCTGWEELPESETALKSAVAKHGPVSTGFGVAQSFLHYKNGIYDGPCESFPNHAMLIVGYGTDKKSKEDFWLIKNSWGTNWGEKGYAKVVRGHNLCGITQLNSYPTH